MSDYDLYKVSVLYQHGRIDEFRVYLPSSIRGKRGLARKAVAKYFQRYNQSKRHGVKAFTVRLSRPFTLDADGNVTDWGNLSEW